MDPAINVKSVPDSPQYAKLIIIRSTEIIDEPKNSGINNERSIESLIEFIATIDCVELIFPNAGIINPEKEK